jgi:hypothetical protein
MALVGHFRFRQLYTDLASVPLLDSVTCLHLLLVTIDSLVLLAHEWPVFEPSGRKTA